MTQTANASITIRHEGGLHARPSVTLTKLAKKFQSKIELGTSENGPWVDAKSIVKVMGTKSPQDSVLHLHAEGDDAEAAIKALVELVESDFKIEA